MHEDEIDLIKLFQLFRKSSFYIRIENLIKFIFNNKIWFILFIVLGSSLGYYLKSKAEPIYRSEMTIKSKALDNSSSEQVVQSLTTLITDGNSEELKKIGFSEVAPSIKNIEFIYPYKEDDSNEKFDSLRRFEPFRIAVYSTKTNSFNQIGDLIVNYLKNNKYSLEDQKSNTKALEQQKEEIFAKIKEIDNMQLNVAAYLQANKNNNFPVVIDPSSLIKEKTNAKMTLIEIDKKLKSVDNYVILRNMIPRLSPESNHNKSMAKFAVLFFLIGGIILRLIKK